MNTFKYKYGTSKPAAIGFLLLSLIFTGTIAFQIANENTHNLHYKGITVPENIAPIIYYSGLMAFITISISSIMSLLKTEEHIILDDYHITIPSLLLQKGGKIDYQDIDEIKQRVLKKKSLHYYLLKNRQIFLFLPAFHK